MVTKMGEFYQHQDVVESGFATPLYISVVRGKTMILLFSLHLLCVFRQQHLTEVHSHVVLVQIFLCTWTLTSFLVLSIPLA